MKTVGRAKEAIFGPGGAVVRSLPVSVRSEFSGKVTELGYRISMDNGIDFGIFEIDDIPDNMQLSDAAEALLEELESIKDQLLRRMMRREI